MSFGDFPTLRDPRHAQAYSPLWDAQLGLWTDKAVQQGLNKRQIDENVVFNLAATRSDLLTGVDPATGSPAPYGPDGVDINCTVIGFPNKPPTGNLADPVPNSQYPSTGSRTARSKDGGSEGARRFHLWRTGARSGFNSIRAGLDSGPGR